MQLLPAAALKRQGDITGSAAIGLTDFKLQASPLLLLSPTMSLRLQFPFISFFVLLTAIQMTHAMTENMRLCGENLVKMMKIVCNNCFNGGSYFDVPPKKRDGLLRSLLLRGNSAHECSQEEDEKESLTKQRKYKTMDRKKRSRQGIVEECCIRSCSYTYMRSYCCA